MATGNRKLYATAPSYLTLLLPFVHSTSFFLLLFLVSLVLFVQQITTRTTTTITSCPRQHFSSTSNSKWQTDWNVLFKKTRRKTKRFRVIFTLFHSCFMIWLFLKFRICNWLLHGSGEKVFGHSTRFDTKRWWQRWRLRQRQLVSLLRVHLFGTDDIRNWQQERSPHSRNNFFVCPFLWAKLIKQFLFYGS